MADGVARQSVWQTYRALLASRLRSQLQYRASFAFELCSSIAVGGLDALEVFVIIRHTKVLGDLDIAATFLVYALSAIGFATADVIAGNLDQINTHIKQGTLDIFMLRPVSILGQLMTSEVTLRRLGRGMVGIVVLPFAREWLFRHRFLGHSRQGSTGCHRPLLPHVKMSA